ncbi:ubiquitin-protein ligase CIP8 [Iris pallida]|uniref:Ubiquitin-protein ligase CIP8 n=1 Tax=Iris pallida TaxID=29817 RepID=A0AAX6FX24_IRIPA|nr:ubiquitin-protein ligase CIP8 [Iris pallida]
MAATESEVMSVGGLFPILVGIAASGSDPASLPDRIVLVNPVTRRVAVLQGDSAAISEMLSDVVAGGGGSGGGGVPPASKRSIEALVSVEVGDDDDDAQECPVCLDELKTSKAAAEAAAKEVKEMPCRHRFHGDCIEKWLGMHGSCPVCRYRMPEEEAEEEPKEVAAAEERRREVQVTIVIRRPTASSETVADDLD